MNQSGRNRRTTAAHVLSSTRLRHVVFLGLSGVALTGCVTQGKYETLMKERDELANRNSALTETLAKERNISKEKLEETLALKKKLDEIKAKTEEQQAVYAKLMDELSSELNSKSLTIEQLKTGINVNLAEDILFPSGSATIRESGREVLTKVSEQLKKVPYQIIVSGFTDNVPISGQLATRFQSNWDLAAARATNVVRLLEQNDVPGEKLIAASYGENQPVASNDTEEGRKRNRRIEIRLRPVPVEQGSAPKAARQTPGRENPQAQDG